MSSGIAYVYDANGTFPLSQLNERIVTVDEFDADQAFLHDVVARHRGLTGSAVTEHLLASSTSRSVTSARSCRSTTTACSAS